MKTSLLGAKPWFPPGTLDHGRFERALLAVLDPWGARWLTSAVLDLAPLYQDLGQARAWHSRSSDGIAAAWRDGMPESFAGQMLGHRIVPGSLHPADEVYVEGLVRSAVDDLLVALDASLAPGRSSAIIDGAAMEGEPLLWWEVRQETRPIFHIGIAEQHARAWRRQSLALAPAIALESRRKGLASQSLHVSAAVGRSAISLAELRGLAVGDTLVLDQHASEPIPLLVDGQPTRLRAALKVEDGRTHLSICGSPIA